ncbi:MAG: hypothetical protein ACRDY6_22310, partial [Acidimicrobiia bacterium]
RVALNTPGAINRPMEILAEGLGRHVNPDLAGFVHAIFSMSDPVTHEQLLREAGFRSVETNVAVTTLHLPPPKEFMWQYINLTPLGAFVGQAPEEAQAALEADVVGQWQEFLGQGQAAVDQPMVVATGRA